jgi:hypothetical protein
MNVFLGAHIASRIDDSIPAYSTGFYTSLSLSLHITVSVETPTYLSFTIWTSFFVPLMLVL